MRNYLASGECSSGYGPFEEGIALSAANKQTRLNFAIRYQRHPHTKTVYTDSKIFVGELTKGKMKRWKVWHPLDGRRTLPCQKHGYQIHVYGAITYYGGVTLVLATGTTGQVSRHVYRTGRRAGQPHRGVCGAEYLDVLNTLIPWINDLFAEHGVDDWWFQQDWAGAHKPQEVQDFIRAHCPNFLSDWPPRCPDISPIENCWSMVESKLWDHGKTWNTFEEFNQALGEAWQEVTQDIPMMRKLVTSVARRLEKVREAQGGEIKY